MFTDYKLRAGVLTAISNGSAISCEELLRAAENARLQLRSASVRLELDATSTARAFRTVNRLIVELEAVHWSRFEERRALASAAQDIIFVPQTTDFALGRVTLLNKVITVVKKVRFGRLPGGRQRPRKQRN